MTFPVHFRYQSPSASSRYAAVSVPAPLVLMQHPVGSASLPCHPYSRDTCLWKLLTSSREGRREGGEGEGEGEEEGVELRVEIPRGLRNTFSHIILGLTALVTLGSMAVILYTMGTVHLKVMT